MPIRRISCFQSLLVVSNSHFIPSFFPLALINSQLRSFQSVLFLSFLDIDYLFHSRHAIHASTMRREGGDGAKKSFLMTLREGERLWSFFSSFFSLITKIPLEQNELRTNNKMSTVYDSLFFVSLSHSFSKYNHNQS